VVSERLNARLGSGAEVTGPQAHPLGDVLKHVFDRRSLRFVPSGTTGLDEKDQEYIDFRDGVSFMTVEVVFLDGTVSERKRFTIR
jgi:hypothetical protein